MNRYLSFTLYATIIILTGIIIMFLAYYPSNAVQYVVGIGMILSSLFAFNAAWQGTNLPIPLKYHGLHAGGLLLYGLAILFFATDIHRFFSITTFFLLYYGFIEMIFCFQLLMMKKMSTQLILVRLFFGFGIALGAVLILSTSYIDNNLALLGAGVIFIISGINLIFFKTILKKLDVTV